MYLSDDRFKVYNYNSGTTWTFKLVLHLQFNELRISTATNKQWDVPNEFYIIKRPDVRPANELCSGGQSFAAIVPGTVAVAKYIEITSDQTFSIASNYPVNSGMYISTT